MQAGKLRRRIEIQRRTATQDDYGQPLTTWTTEITTQAEFEPLNGRELVAAQAVQSEVTHTVTIRYRAGISPSMRVVHRGILYGIEAVVPDQTSGVRYLTLMCTDGVNQG